MKYLLLIYSPEEAWTPEERAACMVESNQLCHDLHTQQKFIAASPLHPVATATSIRIRENKRHMTDGPFAETREQLGGFYIIDVDDLDEAIGVASRIPAAKKGTVEIRPMETIDNPPPNFAIP